MIQSSPINIILRKLGKLNQNAHHNRTQKLRQIQQITTRFSVGRRRMRSEPIVLSVFEEIVDSMSYVRDDTILRQLEGLSE